jgi:Domain of unknown function (DUF397)
MTTTPGTTLTSPWRKSSRSTGGQDCIEVAQADASCLVRDSKNPEGACLAVSGQAWAAFTHRVKSQASGD